MTISKDKTRIVISLHNETIMLIDKLSEYFHLKRSDIVSIAVMQFCNEITEGGGSSAPFPLTTPKEQSVVRGCHERDFTASGIDICPKANIWPNPNSDTRR